MFQFQNGSIKSLFSALRMLTGTLFQFQNGSIKRPANVLCENLLILFQFQNGSTKRTYRYAQRTFKGEFQFQNGSIKRMILLPRQVSIFCFNSKMVQLKEPKIICWLLDSLVFQFQNGSIKSCREEAFCYIAAEVSIPKWFN